MKKMNFTDNYTAMEYALYMITGSYFDKAKCHTPLLEKKMALCYREQKLDAQYRMEEQCIRHVEEELLPQISAGFFNQEVTVFLVKRHANTPTEIRFLGADGLLRMKVAFHPKQPAFYYEFRPVMRI